MDEEGERPAQCLVEQDLPGSVVQMVVSANDVGDLHVSVVDNDGEVVHEAAVGAADDEILQLLILKSDVSGQHVVDHRLALLRNTKPPRSLVLVGATLLKQQLCRLLMSAASLCLTTVFIPIKLEPTHRFEDLLDRFLGRPTSIGVLDPQDKRALMMARKQPIEQGGPCSSYVQIAGRAWGKSHSYHRHLLW